MEEQAPVTFEDVAVYFSRREWETLNEEQKTLYKEVMNENYQTILSLNRPDIIQSIDLGCEPYVQSLSDCDHTGCWAETNMKAESPFQQSGGGRRCEAPVKRQRRYPRVNPFRWIKKDKKKKSRISRSSHRMSKRTKDKKSLEGDDEVKVSSSVSPEAPCDPEDKPLPDEPCGVLEGSKDLCSEADEETDPSAVRTHKIREGVSEGSSQTEVKNDEKPTQDSHLPSNMNCSREADDSRLHGDSKDIPVCEASKSLMEATSESPRKNGSPETAAGKQGKMSPATEKMVPLKKRDRRVKFNEVVTMILIKQQSEERSSKCLESGVKLQRTSLLKNDEDNKKKVARSSTGHQLEDRTSQGQNVLHQNIEGNKQARKRPTGSSSNPSTMKYSKKRIVVGTGSPPQALEQQITPPENNVRERNEPHRVEVEEVWKMSNEGRKMNTCSAPPPPNQSSHEHKVIRSYSCSNCGKITPWSKLSLYQKENIERSIAHKCRTCGRHKSGSPSQAILPLPLTSPGVDEVSQPANYIKKIPADSPPKNTARTQHKDDRKAKRTEESEHLVTASDRGMGVSRKHTQTSQDHSKSSACHQYRDPGAPLDLTLKTTGSSGNSSSTANHSPLGLDSRKNRIVIKDKNVASKSPAEPPIKPGDNRELEVYTTWKERSITEEKNRPSRSDQQKKVTKSRPSEPLKTSNFPQAAVKTHSINLNNTKNLKRNVDPVKSKYDKDCTKCGKSLAMHVTVDHKNPADGSEKNCVLHVETKSEPPPEDQEPFQCKECGKVLTKNHTIPPGERPNSCKECGKSIQDGGNHEGHVKFKTKEKMKTGSLAENTAADTSPPGLGSSYSRTGTKDKKMALKSSAEPSRKTDNNDHEVCMMCGGSFIAEQKNDPLVSDQQKKRTKGRPSVFEKAQDHPKALLKTCSCVSKIRNPKQIENPENLQSNKNCSKGGESAAEHVKAEDPAEGSKKNRVLRLKKKAKQALEGMDSFQCKQCGKTFTRHFTLLQHRTVHTGERPYSCKECGKSFRDGGYLKVHMRLHTKEKPYTCSECGKCFGQNSALMVHLRTHTDERPFQCNECGKSFSDRSTFRHHQMIHTGEKPFTCSFCGKKFTQQAHVKRHEKMHTGERPFGCTMCEKRFIDRTKLRKHELTHNREPKN